MLEIEVASSRIISLFFILIFAKIISDNICRSVPFYYHKIPFCKRIHFSRKKRKKTFLFCLDRQTRLRFHSSVTCSMSRNIILSSFLVCPSYIQFFIIYSSPSYGSRNEHTFFYTQLLVLKKFSVDSSKIKKLLIL